ncbi:MAG: hypothetical protein Q8Q49_04535 [bacterium]|nr:hypothetical protein [bacterium]
MKQVISVLFIKKNKVMLRYVTNSDTNAGPVIPRGNVLAEDKHIPATSEIEHALHRLIYNISKGTMIPLQYEFVRVLSEKNLDELTYVYFIYSWDGNESVSFFPDARHPGRLRFVTIDDALAAVTEETDRKILIMAKETIRIHSVLHNPLYH